MVNHFSPASDMYPLTTVAVAAVAAPRLRYPSVPPGLRALRLGLGALYRVSPALGARAAWRLFITPRRAIVRPWETEAVAEARAFRVPFAGWGAGERKQGPGLMAYEWGAPTAPLVLLVHGWDHRAAFWGAMARGLAAAGYRAVAFDGPAHGASAFAGSGRRTNLLEYHAAIEAVAAAALPVEPPADGARARLHAIVAHSFGAAAVAAKPLHTRSGNPLPRLVLMSAPATLRAVADRFAQLLRLPPAAVEEMSAYIASIFGATFGAFDLLRNGPTLPVERAMLLHDTTDEVVPFTEAQAIAAAWPRLTLAPSTGLGHNKIMRDADVIARVVGFLG